MSQSESYKKALRAAKSVVRGTRKHATTAATGIALLTVPAACSDPTPAPVDAAGQVDVNQNDVISDLKDLVFDTLAPDVLAEIQGGDSAAPPGEVIEPADTASPGETISPEDASIVDASPTDVPPTPADVSSTDVPAETDVLACIETCFQPTDKPCASYTDCEVPEEIAGKCSMTDAECTPAQPCPEGEECEGFVQQVAADVDPNGQVTPWSPVNCLDGYCHEGYWLSDAAKACCADFESWCGGDLPGGCAPWGPPAPPSMDQYRKSMA